MAYSILYPESSMDGLNDSTRTVYVRGPGSHQTYRPLSLVGATTLRFDTVEDGTLTTITQLTSGISRLHIQIQPLRYRSFGLKKSINVKYRSVTTPIQKLSSYLSQLESKSTEEEDVQPFLIRDDPMNCHGPHFMEPNQDGYEYGYSGFTSENVDYPFPSEHYQSTDSMNSSGSRWTSSPSSTLKSPGSELPGPSPSASPMIATGIDVQINSTKPPSSTATFITFGSEADFPFTFTSPYLYPIPTTSSFHSSPLAHSQYLASANTDSPQYAPRSKQARELISSEKNCKVRKIKYLSWDESETEAEEDKMRWKRWKEARKDRDTDAMDAEGMFSPGDGIGFGG